MFETQGERNLCFKWANKVFWCPLDISEGNVRFLNPEGAAGRTVGFLASPEWGWEATERCVGGPACSRGLPRKHLSLQVSNPDQPRFEQSTAGATGMLVTYPLVSDVFL